MARTAAPRLIPFAVKPLALLGADLASVAFAWLAAFWLRFNLQLPDEYLALALRSLLWVVPIYGVAFLGLGLYRGMVRFSSLPDLLRIGRAVALAAATVAVVAYLAQFDLLIPRSVIVLSPILVVLAVGGMRALYRAWREAQDAARGRRRATAKTLRARHRRTRREADARAGRLAAVARRRRFRRPARGARTRDPRRAGPRCAGRRRAPGARDGRARRGDRDARRLDRASPAGGDDLHAGRAQRAAAAGAVRPDRGAGDDREHPPHQSRGPARPRCGAHQQRRGRDRCSAVPS